jgi:hypothetical protein
MDSVDFSRRLLLAVAFVLAAIYVSKVDAQQGPVIERVEPTAGPPGTSVHIFGRRFRGDTRVKIDQTELAVEQRMPHRITARIPEAATTGRIVIETGAMTIVGPEFRVIAPLAVPKISGFSPRQGPPGSEVSIVGRDFSPRLTQNLVLLGKNPVVVTYASPLELRVVIPETAETGRFNVEVINAGKAESRGTYTVTAATAISGFEPHSGAPGTRVAITGQGFKSRINDNRVYLNNRSVRVIRARKDGLIVEIPKQATTGPFLVDVRGAGRAYSKDVFAIQYRPTIVGFSPVEGSAGTPLTIRGTNFGTDPSKVEVKIGDSSLQVLSADRTQLVASLPPDAESGKLSVKSHRVGPALSDDVFKVLEPLRIDNFRPKSGPMGTTVAIQGTGFSSARERNVVKLGKRQLQVISATPTRLHVLISEGPSSVFTVSVQGGESISTTDPFVITVPPRIVSFEPEEGLVGSDITVRGSGFGTNAAFIKASLGETEMEVRLVRDDVVVVRVPSGSQSGPIRLSVPLQGQTVSKKEFRVKSASAADRK